MTTNGQAHKSVDVFLALPGYDSWMHRDALRAITSASTGLCTVTMHTVCSSLLGLTFNTCWCECLRRYMKGQVSHFAMLHADAVPQGPWLDTLYKEKQFAGAQVISAVMAIKNGDRQTSTAVTRLDDEWEADRLSLDDLENLPVTFSVEDLHLPPGHQLLVNTGCMLVELGDWALQTDAAGKLLTYFTVRDQVIMGADKKFRICAFPEDWGFSQMAANTGCKVVATQAVIVDHVGEVCYRTGREMPKMEQPPALLDVERITA